MLFRKKVIFGIMFNILFFAIFIKAGYLQELGDFLIQGQTAKTVDTTLSEENETPQAPVEIWTFLDDYRFITGNRVTLTVQILWQLGVKLDFESLKSLNMEPFRVENVTIGKRQIFENDRDYLVATFVLSLQDEKKPGLYKIPPFALEYINEVTKEKGVATSSDITLKKVPIFVSAIVDRDIFNIGDKIRYSIFIWHEKNIRVLTDQLIKQDFSPFEVLKSKITSETDGAIEKIVVDYDLATYELPEKKKKQRFSIPSISVLYYENDNKEFKDFGLPNIESISNASEDYVIETKQIKTAKIPVTINSLIKKVDVQIEGIKGPMKYPASSKYIKGYIFIAMGTVIIVFVGMSEIKRVKAKMPSLVKGQEEDTSQTARNQLERLVSSFLTGQIKTDREAVIKIDSAFREYMGILVDLSKQESLSIITNDFCDKLKSDRLPDESVRCSVEILNLFDQLIFGNKFEMEKARKAVEDVQHALKLLSDLKQDRPKTFFDFKTRIFEKFQIYLS